MSLVCDVVSSKESLAHNKHSRLMQSVLNIVFVFFFKRSTLHSVFGPSASNVFCYSTGFITVIYLFCLFSLLKLLLSIVSLSSLGYSFPFSILLSTWPQKTVSKRLLFRLCKDHSKVQKLPTIEKVNCNNHRSVTWTILHRNFILTWQWI